MGKAIRAGARALALAIVLIAGAAPTCFALPKEDSTTVGTVVVQGRAGGKHSQSFPTKATQFVRSHAQTSPIGTLARWMDPICPATVGIDPAIGRFVVERILEVAMRVGAPGSKQCIRPNVMVVFTTVPQELMDDVRDHHNSLLGFHYRPEENALATFHTPIEAWHMTAARWANGGLKTIDDVNANAKTPGLEGSPPAIPVWDFSRIKIERADEFVTALIVVDANAVEDQPVGAIADHIAMLALSDPGVRHGCSPLPSLMDALDPACPSSASLDSLSPYDEAFLKGLYASNAEEVLQAERGSIMLRIVRDTHSSATGQIKR